MYDVIEVNRFYIDIHGDDIDSFSFCISHSVDGFIDSKMLNGLNIDDLYSLEFIVSELKRKLKVV